ncbi:MAG: hypothetical protein HC805_08460 [Alkalinema sp. RL_2_19]|nr:hypothetical protein [Alkalinema sp. RL_2_19]
MSSAPRPSYDDPNCPTRIASKIQKFLRSALILPAAENTPKLSAVVAGMVNDVPLPTSLSDLGDLFRVGSSFDDGVPMPNNRGQWFLSIVDPGGTVNRLPGLLVKPDYRLITYLYRLHDTGVGHTVAVVESMASTARLEAALTAADKPKSPPQPVRGIARSNGRDCRGSNTDVLSDCLDSTP